jgi:hypothetical protein
MLLTLVGFYYCYLMENIFGHPREGIHSTRLFGLAFFDILGTLVGAYLLHYNFDYPLLPTFLIFFILANFAI